jgi:hypothetical protein
VRFADLNPQWITPDVVVFRCSACKDGWLSLKTVPMSIRDQFALFSEKFSGNGGNVHPCEANVCWTITDRAFETFTAMPSLNVSGHWHKTITNGEFQ